MKILSYRDAHGIDSVGALLDDGTVADLSTLVPGLTKGPISPLRQLLTATEGRAPFTRADLDTCARSELSALTVSPLVPDATKIIAAPVNYKDHQAEMMEDFHIDALGVFLKAPSSVIAHGGSVRLPYLDRRFDQEGELALVIGRTCRNVPASEADSVIAGYTCLLDITMRGGEDRSTRKSFDTFTPVGPYLVTADDVGPLDELQLRTTVNGVLRQDADIADLIWGVPELVSYVSSVMTLHPGDIISTGTPAGVGQIHAGDTVSVDIDRVGSLTVSVNADAAVTSPTKGAQRGPKPPSELTPVRDRQDDASRQGTARTSR
ncbi:fumarylacetoacetate hydrolase family protein [Streptomyces sp. NEAU-YJ-81]|uniref:fumarylacetoacetate hydrolase family protein n=1 Tax=Streptomyces sp. NEAU-YJ-81 TaxID=2820288 RepID=UPI001ABC67FF|nr:fumarylacetoacetate hydrolase family protein [Streptomyces sp. NEAU-YJ-81]MBO3682510.1 fumarylacetoacetate hydrolase family protein [Streptomyces sp. NEAU-YJ-81]